VALVSTTDRKVRPMTELETLATAARASIKRERFASVSGPLYRERVARPWLFVWTDEDGCERTAATKRDALAAIADHYRP